jgi:TP901 family phage tail tape measure protein
MARRIKDETLNLNVVVNGNKAQKELHELEGQQRRLKINSKDLLVQKKKLEAQNKKNTLAYKNVVHAIKENSAALSANKLRTKELVNEVGIMGLTSRQLRKEATRLKLELSNMIPGSARYKKYEADLDAVNKRLGTLNGRAKRSKSNLSRLADGFNKFSTLGLAAIGVITGIVFSLQSLAEGSAKLSDAQSDVMKTTGKNLSEVQAITRNLAKIDTRTTRLELVELAEQAGRLGKKSTKDIESFVISANKLKVALGDDLKGDAADNIRIIGKMSEQYRVGKETGDDLGASMNRLGSAINEVSASGTSQADYQVDLLKRMSGIANTADITADKIIGLAAAADEAGQSQEITATALSKTIVDMMQNTEVYAEVAKMSVTDFTELLNKDTNEALLQFIGNLRGNNEGMVQMAKRFDDIGVDGQRSIQVLAALANNVDKIRDRQKLASKAMKEATSLTNEYNIKNENLAANLTKLQKNFYRLFVSPEIINGLEKTTKSLLKLFNVTESQSLRKANIEFNSTLNTLTDVEALANISAETRKRLIREVNEQYGQYLPRLITEKDTLNEIYILQDAVNKQMEKKIGLMAVQEQAQRLQQDMLESAIEIERLQHKKSLAGEKEKQGGDDFQIYFSEEHYDEKLKWEKKALKRLTKEYKLFVRNKGKILEEDVIQQGRLAADNYFENKNKADLKKLMDGSKEYFDGYDIANIESEFFNSKWFRIAEDKLKGFDLFIKEKLKSLGKTKEEIEAIISGTPVAIVPDLNKENKKGTKKTELSERQKAANEINAFVNGQNDDEIATLIQHYDELIALAKEHGFNSTELAVMQFSVRKEQRQKAREEEEAEMLADIKKIEDWYAKRQAALEAFNLKAKDDEEKDELALIEEAFEDGLLNHEEYLRAKENLDREYRDKDSIEASKLEEEKLNSRLQKLQNYSQVASAASDIAANMRNAELAGIQEVTQRQGESEESYTQRKEVEERKRREITKKYALLEALTSIANIGMKTAESIITAQKDVPFPLSVLVQGLYLANGLAQVYAAKQQYAKIQGYSSGNYPVQDQYGQRYFAQRNEGLGTGEYSQPTFSFSKNMLVAEKMPEIVIDGLTTQRLKQFRPDVIDAIYQTAGKVKGYSVGAYPTDQRQSSIDLQETNLLLRELIKSSRLPSYAILSEDTRRRAREIDGLEERIKKESKLSS